MMDFSDLAGQRHAQDLAEVAGMKPITKHELSQGYKRYENAGVKLGRAKRNMTDEQLYKMATEDVINWHKATKAEAERKRREEEQRRVVEQQQRVQQEQEFIQAQQAAQQAQQQAMQQAAQAMQSMQQASGGSGGGGGTMLPDTATGGTSTAPRLDNILDPRYKDMMLSRNGFSTASVPAYALASKQQFDAWLTRAIRYRASQQVSTTIASNRYPVIR